MAPSDPLMTLDDDSLSSERGLTMAELKARDDARLAEEGAAQLPSQARPRERDDELLDEIPTTDHHLGRFAGWQAVRRPRVIVGAALVFAALAGVVAFYVHTRELRYERLHPLPEVEATIAPGTPREMTLADGHMRVELSREAPAINLLHLPDRDIELAPRVDKSSFKVEIRDGKTVKIKVLTGAIVETLTAPDATPLLP